MEKCGWSVPSRPLATMDPLPGMLPNFKKKNLRYRGLDTIFAFFRSNCAGKHNPGLIGAFAITVPPERDEQPAGHKQLLSSHAPRRWHNPFISHSDNKPSYADKREVVVQKTMETEVFNCFLHLYLDANKLTS